MKITSIMRFLLIQPFVLLLLSLAVLSCKREIPEGKDFIYAYKKLLSQHKPFCMVIARKDCGVCELFLNTIHKQKGSIQKTYSYVIDAELTENKWVEQWLCQKTTPCTCIFTKDGKLSSIVMGGSEASISMIEQGLNDSTVYSLRFFPSPLVAECGSKILELYNNTLQAYLNKNSDKKLALSFANESLKKHHYFFNLYLKSILELDNSLDTALLYAKKALDLKNLHSLYYYTDLRNELRTLTDSTYNAANEPILTLSESPLNMGDCSIGKEKKFSIKVKNTGLSPLTIYSVDAGCDCLNVSWPQGPIEGNNDAELSIFFIPDKKGFVNKKIMIVSNAQNPVVLLNLEGLVI